VLSIRAEAQHGLVWDLSSHLVKGKSRDQTDDGVGDPSRNRNQIRICDLRKVSQPVDTATDLHNLILVAKPVQSSRMDAPSGRFGGVQETPPFRRKMLSAASLDAAVCLTKTVYPPAGYNLLQLSVSADNSIQSRFRSLAASRPGCHMSPYQSPTRSNRAAASCGRYGGDARCH
jgi:hypothetical protein